MGRQTIPDIEHILHQGPLWAETVSLGGNWRRLSSGDIGIVTIVHERMHQMDRFRDDLGA